MLRPRFAPASLARLLSTAQVKRIKRSDVHTSGPRLPVLACCTADSFDFAALSGFLQKKKIATTSFSHDTLTADLDGIGSVYFFENGTFVIWGSDSAHAPTLVSSVSALVRPFTRSPLAVPETEEMHYVLEDETTIRHGDLIVLQRTDASLEKLAFANGLADSVKLASFETAMDAHIALIKPIPVALASGGRLPVDRDRVLRLRGQLLSIRSAVNLQSDLVDPPDLYWSEPALDAIYRRITRSLETGRRVSVLNAKMDYANELGQVLATHLSERHSTTLEWGIIGLITVEVLFELLHWVL